ncbi:MAG: choline dehydrogenase [Rhodospirillaceae bacterium]|nr:choline dehydrogenase [Rhodospirillaceae bacterium]|tara:strand:+ start:6708 stop:8318 length:1611 start_codon:yes stop_codon:yes gene_type:complete
MSEQGFDYVIVGGGTAGGVLASRLTEDPIIRVLVVEAGPDHRGLMNRVPAGVLGLYQAGTLHWDYKAKPEEHASGQVLPYKMGKIIGGSSSINSMLWTRGAPAVYDGWAAEGCTGWSYDDIEPLYRRIERASVPDDQVMGQSGPIGLTRGNPSSSPLNEAFLEAAQQAGHPLTENYNGPIQDGACVLYRNTDNGERSDVYRGYLEPARKRPNLTIRCNTAVERIVFDGKRATGVEVMIGGRREVVTAKREVLLCAGAIASPQLLMLSGIGNPAALTPHGIPVQHELPGVGKNLHTHPAVRVAFTCTKPVSLLRWTKPPLKWLAGIEWLLKRTGAAATNHMDVAVYARTDPGLPFADAMLDFTPLVLGRDNSDGSIEGFAVYMELVSVKSRGRLELRSSDPRARPVFGFNFLEDERDLTAFRTGVHMMRKIVGQSAFDPWREAELDPGADVNSDDEINDWIRRTVTLSHHVAGSCRMGAADDPQAVVAPDLKVRGLKGLRVADNAIMPFVTNGNTHAPAIMIGEKAFDLVRESRTAG